MTKFGQLFGRIYKRTKGNFFIIYSKTWLSSYLATAGYLAKIIKYMLFPLCRSSYPEVFSGKGVLEICIQFTGENPFRSASSINMFNSPVNLLHFFRTPFPRNTSGRLLLIMSKQGFGQNQ